MRLLERHPNLQVLVDNLHEKRVLLPDHLLFEICILTHVEMHLLLPLFHHSRDRFSPKLKISKFFQLLIYRLLTYQLNPHICWVPID